MPSAERARPRKDSRFRHTEEFKGWIAVASRWDTILIGARGILAVSATRIRWRMWKRRKRTMRNSGFSYDTVWRGWLDIPFRELSDTKCNTGETPPGESGFDVF